MFGSIRIATIRGIPIRVHITLLAMFGLLIFQLQPVLGLLAGFMLFGSVLLHELGHSFVAQRYGIRIASIVLHLLGGMALMTRPPDRPRDEIMIAAAGPAVSFTLGLILGAISLYAGVGFEHLAFVAPVGFKNLLAYATAINLMMGVFNLVPALPMDGGRIFRAMLSGRIGALPATRFAAWVSRAFGVAFIAIGLSWTSRMYSFVLVGMMLFLMVANEVRVAEAQELSKLRKNEELKETREEFTDALGRRYVVVTRMID